MGILISILGSIGFWSPPQPRPVPVEPISLGSLPPELIVHIIQFLPPESILSFSMCCSPIHSLLKSKHDKIIKDGQWNRCQGLKLLERDLPGHILCHHCKKLHAMKRAHQRTYDNWRYQNMAKLIPCCQADFATNNDLYIHSAFSTTLFWMTMKLYRLGLDHSEFLNLLSYDTETSFGAEYIYPCVASRTASTRIVDGSMLIREQRKYTIPASQLIAIPKYFLVAICRHILFSGFKHMDTRDVEELSRRTVSRDCQTGEKLTRCTACFTEYRVDFKECGNRGNVIYVTKWQDLGRGQSHRDPKWLSHLRVQFQSHVQFELGSICAAFEGQKWEAFKFDSV